ncbi:MAG: homocysteine S-methyltransferase family protein [Fimbriimonadaceae bacterium]|nr:MAG: homocysteine S-methyltransferase family protein [Fimbriimonadaceae bacterium]
MNSPFLDRLAQGVMIFDGATGTQYQAANLPDSDFVLQDREEYPESVRLAARRLDGKLLDGCNEILNFTRPDVVEQVHLDYFNAGSDIVETNSFGSTSIVLAEYEIEELVYETSFAAATIARRAADKATQSTGEQKFVAGGVGPGTKLISLGQTDWETLLATYTDSIRGLIDGGVDVVLLETLQDLLMVKAGIVASKDAMVACGRQVPIIVQVTMEQTGTMLVGSDIAAALNMIECFPEVVAIGMNCATGPDEMAPFVRFLGENSTRPISIQPNAGLPMMEKGQAVYKLTPEQLADAHEKFVTEHGVALAGGCCGTTPAHIAEVAKRVKGRAHTSGHWVASRDVYKNFDFQYQSETQQKARKLDGCSSLYEFVPYQQDNSFLIVGERTNANGSKAFREMLAAENWEGLTELARELEGEGSHLIDVCTAYVGRNEEKDMVTLLKSYNQHIQAPIMIDSTEANVIEAALQNLAGKPVINSINFEDGEERTRKVLGFCQRYGAAVVALTIDESGMAKTIEQKVAVAERILKFTREYGLPDSDVFIDALTFTLGSGDEEFRESAINTIEAIREIKKRNPLVNTILGVSNVSFGLKPALRVILNSVFLQYAQEAGLTSAIVHFSKIVPETRVDAEVWQIASDLVFDKRKYAEVS